MADFSVKFENMKACQAAIDNCGDIVKRSISNLIFVYINYKFNYIWSFFIFSN